MWISVKERLPGDDKDYLVITEDGYQTVANFIGFWVLSDAVRGAFAELSGEVTHWQALPEPPAQD